MWKRPDRITSPMAGPWLLVTLLVVSFVAYGIYIRGILPNLPFDPNRWRETTGKQRRPQAERFLKEYQLTQLSPESLTALLGKSDSDQGNWFYELPPPASVPVPTGAATTAAQGARLWIIFEADRVIHAQVDGDAASHSRWPFTADRWADPNLREPAARDLVGRKLLERKTSAEVLRLLGSPDTQDHKLVYDLGPDWMGIDRVWMSIGLDEDGKIISGKVVYG